MFVVGAYIDKILNSITMYRLVLYSLIFLSCIAFVFSYFNIIHYSTIQLLSSLIILLSSGLFFNIFFSKLLNAPTNVESIYITEFILFFLLLPPEKFTDILIILLTSFIAVASKFFIATKHKHIFNPAAISAVIIGALGFGISLWWIGIPQFLPLTLTIGLLVVRKIRKFRLFLMFLTTATFTASIFGILKGTHLNEVIEFMFLSGPIIFFASIMLTEPSTTPPTAKKQLIYASLIGLIYGSQFKIGPFFSSPELALVFGNIYSYFVSFKEKLILILESQKEIALDTFEFVFKTNKKVNFVPGQYLEWTLPHKKSDGRGVRRYFTIASSPTESEIKLGVKFNQNPSSFKKKLKSLAVGTNLSAGQLMGDFLLPSDSNKKLVFIAGGIGVTPFRSMIQFLIDKNEKRSIILFYSNKVESEIAYKDIFEKAKKIGIQTVYLLTDEKNIPAGWNGERGRLNENIIGNYIHDIKEQSYFLSGPNSMVHSYKELLIKMGATHIVTDYFPGF